MLKIYINNEEVVANQNFTINKHMLNTPSVILNNVCPKSWCENKDYSNFYHPQDYSKCKIQDETYIPAEPGIYTTITGSATIQNVDTSKLQEVIQLDGNTTQSGTPTPTSPQPINVVSGRQEVVVCGKNLLDINNSEHGAIDSSGTAVANPYSWRTTKYIKVKPNTKYTFSNNTGLLMRLYEYNINQNFISPRKESSNDATTFTITTGATTEYLKWTIYNINSITLTREIVEGYNLQIEYGETATTYEAYKGQTYEINLGKNLFDKDNATTFNGYVSPAQSKIIVGGSNDKTLYIMIQPNTNYTISKIASVPFYVCTSTSVANNTSVSNARNVGNTATSYTITSGSNDIYLCITYFNNSSTSTEQEILDSIQIEKGNATSYAPYKTPIELCKIGDYKDRIYKDSGKWYIEKNIGKVVLNGTENWEDRPNFNDCDRFVFGTTIITIQTQNGFSNYFNVLKNSTSNIGNIWLNSGTQIIVNFSEKGTTTLAQFKTWLSTHNTEVYYVLATPTYTEITDSELISQLEAISLINGLNNVSISSPYLTAPITIHYNFINEETIIDLLFCGVVKNSGKISLNPREPHLTTLQILDFKDFLSSGETLDYVIYQKTILEAIQQVINSISDYGFVLGNINILNPNEVIGAYSTKDKTAYDVFNYIADITQSRWTARMIDENTVAIDFYDPTLMTQGTAIDYTQSYFENNLIDDMKYNYGTNNYRNKQIMVSNQVIGNLAQIQTLYSNGYQDQYIVDLPIAQIDSIYVDGEKKEVATEEDKYLGINADFYYSVNSNVIESEKIYTASSKIEINYVPVIEGRQVITNNDEISRINTSTGRKGIVSRYEQRNDATTLLELQKIGESYIKYKGTPEIVLTIDSRKNLWEVGQRVEFNAPIEDLDTEYMVRTKKINYIVSVDTLFYTYELVSSFNSETEINYFDNQRAKSKGNIGDGEYISRNIDIENVANVIFYDTTATEITLTGDNTLNSILNSPFID